MNFELSDEQRTIRDTLRQFAEREIKPNSAKWDKEETFPREVIGHLGELGFLGISFPERFGGGAADTLSQALVVEGLSRYDASVGLTCAAHMSLSSGHINLFAAEEHRAHYLPEMVAAKKLGAWCLTEPGAGSDAAAMETRAVRKGDNFVINGSKMFIQRHGRRRIRGDGGDGRGEEPLRNLGLHRRARHARAFQRTAN